MYRTPFDTPYGQMALAVNGCGDVVDLWLPNKAQAAASSGLPAAARNGIRAALLQLGEYFAGRRRDFDLPIAPEGTPFELRVWNRLREIPYGTTTSYGAIAAEFGMKNGARAVGRANGSNRIPIIIPCHRVIGSGGSLTGFGGGLPLKESLLQLEGALQPPLLQPR